MYGGLFTYLYTDINGVYHSVETGKELSREEMLYLSEIEVEIYGINQSSVNKNALLDNIRSTRSTVAMTTGAVSTSWLYNTGSYCGDSLLKLLKQAHLLKWLNVITLLFKLYPIK